MYKCQCVFGLIYSFVLWSSARLGFGDNKFVGIRNIEEGHKEFEKMSAEVANSVTENKLEDAAVPAENDNALEKNENSAVDTGNAQDDNAEKQDVAVEDTKKENETVPAVTAKSEPTPKCSVHKTNFEKDMIYLYQFSRTPLLPSLSPYCLKVETWLRLAGLKYEVSSKLFC